MPYIVGALLVLALVLGAWLAFGPGPRRARAYRRAQRLLEQGQWQQALKELGTLQARPGLSASWQEHLRGAAGECHQLATDQAIKEKRFEDALEHALRAGALLGLTDAEQRTHVLDAMLAEARRLFAGSDAGDTQATLQMLARVLAIQTPCPEASFWQGLCLVRQGNLEQGMHALGLAHEQAGKQVIDPALYLGLLLARQGKHTEALRYLAEANRIDATCPFVTWQMGQSMVAGGGDSLLALKALQRALGPRGLPLWQQSPDRAWVEAFPEGKSYVRRLASRHVYPCPVLGRDLNFLIRQGQQALAAAHYRQGNFQESADLYTKLLQDSPPTLPLLRGLGLALARQEKYDQAYKHLRTALEQEAPKDAFTAGYLALCGALGKPTQPEDKPRNVSWAIRLLARFPVPGNAEWARIISAVFAEARALGMELPRDEQLLLCDTLASVHAVDAAAAEAFAHLARSFPDAVRPAHAWLYVRAAAATGFTSSADLDLFARTFAEGGPARAYFEQQGWSLEEAEYTYLERAAAQAPGTFPPVLGVDYARQGEQFLLDRSAREEAAGRAQPARACVEVLLRLAPSSLRGHDRLACLHYKGGDRDRAVALLTGWQRLAPTDHWPLVRQAIIEQERGNAQRRAEAIDRALGLTRGRLRAAIAYLGARLALRSRTDKETSRQADKEEEGRQPEGLESSLPLLQECLRHDPDHVEALSCLAAVRSVLGDREGLAAQAPTMNRPAVHDARFHYLGAVCHLAAGDYSATVELGRRALADESLAPDSQLVMAWAWLHLHDNTAATQALEKVAAREGSSSAVCARALLGRLHLEGNNYEEAARWWQGVEPRRRATWGLDEPLRQTVLLSGLTAFEAGRFEQAAERFREAGRLGLRDRRLGPLMAVALVKAGQRILFEQSTAPASMGKS